MPCAAKSHSAQTVLLFKCFLISSIKEKQIKSKGKTIRHLYEVVPLKKMLQDPTKNVQYLTYLYCMFSHCVTGVTFIIWVCIPHLFSFSLFPTLSVFFFPGAPACVRPEGHQFNKYNNYWGHRSLIRFLKFQTRGGVSARPL